MNPFWLFCGAHLGLAGGCIFLLRMNNWMPRRNQSRYLLMGEDYVKTWNRKFRKSRYLLIVFCILNVFMAILFANTALSE